MIREEAVKFLTDTKVYVKDKSEEIQKKLFDIGFKWNNELKQNVEYTDKPFLFLYEGGGIAHSANVKLFYNHPHKEVTIEDILNITIDEPKYRPFKDAAECWEEMLKHKPFGWIKNKYGGDWQIMATVSNFKDFKKIFAMSTFADGTPFGIKED